MTNQCVILIPVPKLSGSIQVLDVGGLREVAGDPLYLRIAARLRSAILAGNLTGGSRLPSSRILARDLKASRPTVERAFDQLRAEGFLVRRRGSGTFVAAAVPERERRPETGQAAASATPGAPSLAQSGVIFAAYPSHRESVTGIAFTPSLPAPDLFPRQAWERLVSRAIRRPGADYWEYGASAGHRLLRTAIAAHVAGTRAVACAPEQVIVVSSTQQAVDLAARVLLGPGDAAWVEDPSYPPAVNLLRIAGAAVAAIPVDGDGFDVEAALAIHPPARMVYVTPSHQYPSGGLMSLPRRLALLAWAARDRAWILEDDYDGDLRYSGRPLASLQALDPAGRVIYIGTFNKMMFPSLRIAFLVAPPSLVDPFTKAKHLMDGHAPSHTQVALAEFIAKGHLATHLRHLLGEYESRRGTLLAALETLLDKLDMGSSNAGLHLAAYLRRPLDDRRISAECARLGVDLHPLSRFYLGPPRAGFVLGFACSRPSRTHTAMRLVARVIGGQTPMRTKVVS